MGSDGTLDQQRWSDLWAGLQAHGNGISVFNQLSRAYSDPSRAYHNGEHISECLAELDGSRHLANRPDEVEAALWFHDAVYLPGALDNEVQSSRLARSTLSDARVPQPTVDRIVALVLATAHRGLTSVPDEQLTCDIDLSILGREPAVFEEFERRIRQEYSWVPEGVYRRERSAVLSTFLRRSSIYQTEHFRQRYEGAARTNLEHLLAQFGSPQPTA
jgi:predicted metal-dependent HD superfamily phosphohydrolase